MKRVNGHEVINLFEQWSPKSYALEGDPVGVHVGQLNRPVEKVLVTLDVNEEVVDEAIEKGANLIIAHHPPIFRPLKNIATDTVQGRMFEKCIKHDITIYAAHTNLDVAKGGVNDMLAEKIGLVNTKVMEQTYSEALYKMIVFCPATHAEEMRIALGQAGAGAIGEYTACSFTSEGAGRFTPADNANPYIGQVGKEEVVAEEKIEVIVPAPNRNRVLKAMLNAHPYEEPAYDILKLEQRGNTLGLGRVGELEEPLTLDLFASKVKDVFQVPALRYVGDPNKMIRKVAVLGGDGNKYIHAAKRNGADVLVTGDLYYHVAHDAESINLAVVDPGHNIEKVMIEGVAVYMQQACNDAKFAVNFLKSEVNTEPFQFK
ncbi:Nif3-like dinuclear metal center hexameric protein [Sporosarcina pasteurii]|uniref:GTP cyclohydrolase 1 type 2 homolog n=1 Tax=Sporosarcina pasteurii TaxID=1474 RepID=A0A380BQ38_SPOPA|nr:Nif3-like dinuclear metal center hexameric protein [Sporosarcina pasteurii]MDS9471045.1 Nif3-like dinuclear metal center hexameric protein [Sporosarcina pasteurii]QBQ05309.1 Nif3-like dinuclear metal center hexameric protein [Sporosarcina pasteurii]SUJ04124.1 metal-binding protein [Sporosarcina pasteurii]